MPLRLSTDIRDRLLRMQLTCPRDVSRAVQEAQARAVMRYCQEEFRRRRSQVSETGDDANGSGRHRPAE